MPTAPQASTDILIPALTDQPQADHLEGGMPHLGLQQIVLFSAASVAGGLVFTLMNNALPLFLLSYAMPLGLPAFLNPGGPMPATIIGLLANERSFLGGLIQPFMGQLSDRTRSPIGKRSPYLLIGGVGTALALGSLAFQPPFWLMLAAVALSGVFLYVALGPYAALLADITPYSQRGRVGSFMSLGGVAGAIFLTVMSQFFWDSARGLVFIASALLVVASLAVTAFGVHEPSSEAMPQTRAEKHPVPIWREVLGRRTLALYTGAMCVYWLGAGAASPFITRFGVAELHIKESESFSLLLVIVLSTIVGAAISGLLADRFGRKLVLQRGLVVFAIAALIGSQVRTLEQALPIMVLVGMSNAVPTSLHLPLLADLVPKARAGACMGFANMLWSVAQPVGSILAGLLVDFTHSYRGIFIFAGVCMLLSVGVLRGVKVGQGNVEAEAEL